MSAASLDTSTAARKPTARDRLLAAADELFYAEGVHTVGIDRIIERAGVAKASLYSSFGSKDELVRAYLQGREERRPARGRSCSASSRCRPRPRRRPSSGAAPSTTRVPSPRPAVRCKRSPTAAG